MTQSQKTVGIDTIELSIPIDRKLHQNQFLFGARLQHQEQSDGSQKQPLGYQDDIAINWNKDLRGYYLPEVHFVDYPSPVGGRCYEYQIRHLSLPKLMYGNNISEIPSSDFEKVVNQLHRELLFLELPIEITQEQLRNAKVCRVDYGKNIIFTDGTDMELLNEMLDRAPLRKRSKKGKTQYHSGELFRDSIKSRAFIIYDKLAEFKTNERKARPAYGDEDQGFDTSNLDLNKKLVRFEVQVQRTKQLKIELERLGFDKSKVSFAEVFSPDIATAILSHYWCGIEQAIRRNTKVDDIDELLVSRRFSQITQKDKSGPTKVFGKLGFNISIETCGLSMIKSLFETNMPRSNWGRTKTALLVDIENKDDKFSCLDTITSELKEMKCLSAEELKNEQ